MARKGRRRETSSCRSVPDTINFVAPRSSTFGDDDHNYGGGDVDDNVNDDVGDGDDDDDNDVVDDDDTISSLAPRSTLISSSSLPGDEDICHRIWIYDDTIHGGDL